MPLDAMPEICRVRRALKAWRESHSAPSPIPHKIWSQAAQLAGAHGVGPVARELGLDHAKLRRLAEVTDLVPVKSPDTTAAFVELRSASGPCPMSCVVEVDSADGSTMRASLSGASPSDLAVIFREFSGREPDRAADHPAHESPGRR